MHCLELLLIFVYFFLGTGKRPCEDKCPDSVRTVEPTTECFNEQDSPPSPPSEPQENNSSADTSPPPQKETPTNNDNNTFAAPAVPGKSGNRNTRSPGSDVSDCGYATQVENPNSVSTSSSTDDYSQPPVHQKPPATNQKQRKNSANKTRKTLTPCEKIEWRRKKLVKRSLSTMINMKGMVNHIPTNDDVTNILKEFSVDFLLKGYGMLVSDLHQQLLRDNELIDTSHFFWLITYFLKFAGQLELDLGYVHSILTFDIIGYSMFEAATICEQLETSGYEIVGSSLRRLHLSVTAIREFLQSIEAYNKIGHLIRADDVQYLMRLESQIAASNDLKNLFVLLIRRFNPSIQSKQYLQDLIVTNHHLVVLLDRVARRTELTQDMSVTEHVQQ